MVGFTADDMKRVEVAQAPQPPQGADVAARRVALAEHFAGGSDEQAYSPVVLSGVIRVVEFLIVIASAIAMHQLYLAPTLPLTSQYLELITAVAVLFLLASTAMGTHTVSAYRNVFPGAVRLLGCLGLLFLAALAAIYFLKLDFLYSRVWLLGWYLLAGSALLIERTAISAFVRRLARAGRLEKRVVVVGGGQDCENLLRTLTRDNDGDLRIYGVFDDRSDERSPQVVAGFPKLGSVDDLVDLARHARIDLVIFSMPITAEQRLLQMLRKLWVLPIDIRLAAHMSKLRFRPRSYSYIGSVPVLDVFDKPIADWDIVLKSAFDRCVGAICLLLLSPVMLAVALAVKLDSRGPVLFRQKRYGFNNELIEIFKFRSMYVDQLDHGAHKLAVRNDPRVTRVGRFIRKTSLDELPQLFNVVFKGNLSLVGPRPHAVHAKAADRQYDEVVEGYFARHRVRPGITGWAQINGWRGETDTPEKLQKRVKHDLYYIENWSILFDIYILARTPFALIKAENAY
jgi:Undecaprenyl-phosphate glucose phosphotransferase